MAESVLHYLIPHYYLLPWDEQRSRTSLNSIKLDNPLSSP